ncbi:hypothetical protein D3C75_1375490 [compost metagenome]
MGYYNVRWVLPAFEHNQPANGAGNGELNGIEYRCFSVSIRAVQQDEAIIFKVYCERFTPVDFKVFKRQLG